MSSVRVGVEAALARAPHLLRTGSPSRRLAAAKSLLEQLAMLDADDEDDVDTARKLLRVLSLHWSVADAADGGLGLAPTVVELLETCEPAIQMLLVESASQLLCGSGGGGGGGGGGSDGDGSGFGLKGQGSYAGVEMLVEAYKELLAADRSFLTPIVGSLSDLPLSAALKEEVLALTQVALSLVDEQDVPVVVKALLSTATSATGRRV